MKKIVLSLLIILVISCSDPFESLKEEEKTPELTSTIIKGSVSKSRNLSDITHVAAIPITDNYSPAYIVENLNPITIDENGEYLIENINTDVIIVLLSIIDDKTSVVDFVSLQQGEEGLLLLPLDNIDPTVIDLGNIDTSSSTSAISDLLPESFSNMDSSQLSELATLDNIYRNIENHINNSNSVDGEDATQVFYIKPEICISNSIKDLYKDLEKEEVLANSKVDYTLVQFATLPVNHTVTEIETNFSIQSPSGDVYACSELYLDGGISDEGELFTKRYSDKSSTVNMMFEYCWDNMISAKEESEDHVGNVNFFRPEIDGWIPEHGIWKYLWGNEIYGEFDVSFGQVYDSQKRFQGYFPKPELIYDENLKLTQINIEWFYQVDGVITPLTDLTIAKNLMTNFDVELAAYNYIDNKWNEFGNHIDDPGMTAIEIKNDVYLINNSIINSEDDINLTNSKELQDGKTYVERIYIMYSLGNELAYTFQWQSHIMARD